MHLKRLFLQAIALLTLVSSPTVFAQSNNGGDWLDVQKGKSLVLQIPKDTVNVSLTDDKIANVSYVKELQTLMLQGLSVGTTDLIVSQRSGPPQIFEVTVHQDLSGLIRRINAIVEGEPPQIYPLKGRIVVEGVIDDLNTLEQVSMVAKIFDSDFVNLMSVRGDHQVQLEVVFAEVSRTGLRELGINVWFPAGGVDSVLEGPASTQNRPLEIPGVRDNNGNATSTSNERQLFAPGAAGFRFMVADMAGRFAAYVSILDDYKLAKLLAQPTVVALSGQKGEFLAGGEVPIPSAGGGGQVQVEFKEYGIALSFVPTVLAGDVIDLQVNTSVSEPDYSVASRLTGVEVPGFATRKASSHVRIDSGMTFAMAGMILEETQYSKAVVPILGEIPIIGSIFRYVRHQRVEKEIIVFITPRLVRPLAPGEMPAPPGTTEDNNPSDVTFFLLGMQRRAGSRTATPTASIGLDR
jgi:pilus assembly protein CpaC